MRTYRTKSPSSAIGLKDIIKSNKRQFIILVVIAAVVLVAVFAGISFANRQELGSSFLVTGDTIKIGLRTDTQPFGYVDDTGEIVGFDRDYIDEALGRMMAGQEKLYEYVPITSQNAGASIKYGNTNMNMGLLVDDDSSTSRTKGFRVTDPYYIDNIVAVVHGSSKLDKLSNMDGGKIGALTMALDADELMEYLEKNKITTELARYSDYESAMTDIEHNRVSAVIMPYAIARQFETNGFRVLAEPLYEVGYCVMLPTGQAAFANEMSRVIREMDQDGTAEELRRKWGL